MRILALSSNNGEGHNSASRAILEDAAARGVFGVMIDTLMFDSPRHSDSVKKIHVKSALRAPVLFKYGNEIAEKMSESSRPSLCYYANSRYAERIYRFIEDNGFDTVVATHIFAAEALTCLLREHPGAFRGYFVVTDYSYTPFLPETALDAYFIPHALMTPYFERMAPGKIFVPTGIPVSESKLKKTEKSAARAALGLPVDAPLILLMTGSMGFGDLDDIAAELLRSAPAGTQILALCGTNRKLRAALEERFGATGALRALPYTDRVGLYLDAADVLMSKPGGLSSTEAAVKEVPLVHITPLPGWEEDNVSFFTSLGISKTGRTPQEMAAAAVALLTDADARAQMIACQRRYINKFAARDLVDYLIADAR